MSLTALLLTLFTQPEYGLPLVLLAGLLVAWGSWPAHVLPAALTPYTLRRPWLLDSLRLLHETLHADKLAPAIQITYTWLAQEFRREYGVPISRLFRPSGYVGRSRIPDRPRFRRVVRALIAAFYYADYSEDVTRTGRYARWRRPGARARARRTLARALDDLDALFELLGQSGRDPAV